MAAKQKKAPTFSVVVRHGTPSHMDDEKTYSIPSTAKKFLLGRVEEHHEWAKRYNHTCAEQLDKIRTEINDLDLRGLHVGEVRSWVAEDDYTGVRFVFSAELVSR